MVNQRVVKLDIYAEYRRLLRESGRKSVFLVCGPSLKKYETGRVFLQDECVKEVFTDFHPNPDFDSVINGVRLFNESKCDCILAIGGGSAIDVAKAVKAFAGCKPECILPGSDIEENEILLWAAPTTAGTGSEATHFAVIYYEGEKKSVEHASLMPDTVFLDSAFLKGLPEYQRKATMMDAFCHSAESFWSVNATDESRSYAVSALKIILESCDGYLLNSDEADRNMLWAAHLAGRAINISKTTAAHAMCYKLTTLYGLPHGHAAALCLRYVWEYTWKKAVAEGDEDLKGLLNRLAVCVGERDVPDAVSAYAAFLERMDLNIDFNASDIELEILTHSVNEDRLNNHPVKFTGAEIREMYGEILFAGIGDK